MKTSFFYADPRIYIWGIKFIHKKNFYRRYRYMADLISPNETILEPACGPAVFPDFLDDTTLYTGFDTNRRFINYGVKKGLRVYHANALNPKSFKKTDHIVACDILHHLKKKDRPKFLKLCLKNFQKQLVICEPGINQHHHHLPARLFNYLTFEIPERDGTNRPKASDRWTTEELRKDMENGFGVIPKKYKRTIKRFGEDLIVSYSK